MTDYQLPVLRHLTADEVVPGMTIAGRCLDKITIGVAFERQGGSWSTEKGWDIASHSGGYDLLAEAPKPAVKLPQEVGAVIRYKHHYYDLLEIAKLLSLGPQSRGPKTWMIAGDTDIFDDERILARGAKDGYEVASWTKPGDQ